MVAARRADDLCGAYLLNTKTFYEPTVYGYTAAVVGLLQELGVRTVRERVATGESPGARQQRYAMNELLSTGVRWHATVATLEDWPDAAGVTAEVMNFLSTVYGPPTGGNLSALLHSFGGCNEVDGPVVDDRRDPQWAPHARIMQAALWQRAKASPFTRSIPVAGPSLRTDVTVDRAAELGDLSAICDWGNVHLYNRGTSPTRGIDRQLEIMRSCYPDVGRWVVSETGYNDSPQTDAGRTVPEEAAATYAVRGICDYFLRDAIYGRFELLDDPDRIDFTSQTRIDATAQRQAHFGLVAMTEDSVSTAGPDTWRKKPEFYATQQLLALLSDRGDPFVPDGLRLEVVGDNRDVQQLLLQKRDGRHYLALWRDVEVATTYPEGALIDVRPVRLTVRVSPRRPVAVYAPAQRAAPIATTSATGAAVVDLAGDLLILEIG
ncbi:MAG: hypothetical protein H0U77_01635 [Nocardioidaceae bacterium]|nr:hypothetical protein [Nocardioidaceae bacterium]